MSSEHVHVEHNGDVTTVILDRPQARNAVDRHTGDALVKAFLAFETDARAKAAVLWGAGGYFCAGADLKGLSEGRGNRLSAPGQHFDPHSGDAPMGPTRMRLSKPVIAAVAGFAVAGGLELACWCDLRIVEEDGVFGVFCRRFGVPLIDGGTVRLPRLIGMSRALDLILTGRAVDAREAERIGLANRVVPTGTALAAARELAATLADFPQGALRGDRRSCIEQAALALPAALAHEFAIGAISLDEATQGAQRFVAGAGRGGRFDSAD